MPLAHISFEVLLSKFFLNVTKEKCFASSFLGSLPSSGLSEVTGIVSDTVLRNTVNDRRIVTPVERRERREIGDSVGARDDCHSPTKVC